MFVPHQALWQLGCLRMVLSSRQQRCVMGQDELGATGEPASRPPRCNPTAPEHGSL